MKTSQVVDRWHEEGRAEGRVEGLAEGQLEARRQWLLALLESRFGSLPKELIQRLQDVKDVEQLDRAFQQALNVHSLADLQL